MGIFTLSVVSENQTVAMHAEFSKETRGVKLNKPNPAPSTVNVIAPEVGEFLRVAAFTSRRCTETTAWLS